MHFSALSYCICIVTCTGCEIWEWGRTDDRNEGGGWLSRTTARKWGMLLCWWWMLLWCYCGVYMWWGMYVTHNIIAVMCHNVLLSFFYCVGKRNVSCSEIKEESSWSRSKDLKRGQYIVCCIIMFSNYGCILQVAAKKAKRAQKDLRTLQEIPAETCCWSTLPLARCSAHLNDKNYWNHGILLIEHSSHRAILELQSGWTGIRTHITNLTIGYIGTAPCSFL